MVLWTLKQQNDKLNKYEDLVKSIQVLYTISICLETVVGEVTKPQQPNTSIEKVFWILTEYMYYGRYLNNLKLITTKRKVQDCQKDTKSTM